ncbi:MAG: inositol monophosphatase family protein [Pseudomonadota bacterium]
MGQIGSAKLSLPVLKLSEVIAGSQRLPLSAPTENPFIIVGSRSHATPELEAFVDAKRREFATVTFIPAGSPLKFCMVAEGRAAIYPRMGHTMEWDTVAGQAIVTCAGARVVKYDTDIPLECNKKTLGNLWFIVAGGTGNQFV